MKLKQASSDRFQVVLMAILFVLLTFSGAGYLSAASTDKELQVHRAIEYHSVDSPRTIEQEKTVKAVSDSLIRVETIFKSVNERLEKIEKKM